jgi:hypothetical protein
MYFSQLPPCEGGNSVYFKANVFFTTSPLRRGKEGDDISKIIPRRKNTLMLFIYEDGTMERVVEMEE